MEEYTIFNTDPFVRPEGKLPLDEQYDVPLDIRSMREGQTPTFDSPTQEQIKEDSKIPRPSVRNPDVPAPGGGNVFNHSSYTSYDGKHVVIDSAWAKNAFTDMHAPTAEDDAARLRDGKLNAFYRTSADFKFEDTSLGGAIGVGAKPSYCRYSDVRVRGLSKRAKTSIHQLPPKNNGLGMGRFYSEQLDDNQMLLYLRFGVVEFNSLIYFFNTMVVSDLRRMMTHGQVNSWAYTAGRFIATSVLLYKHPLYVLTGWLFKDIAKATIARRSKFYNIKPTMHIYWNIVYTIVNTVMANLHFMDMVDYKDSAKSPRERADKIGTIGGYGKDVLGLMGIRLHNGSIDVIATINRTTMQYNSYLTLISQIDEQVAADERFQNNEALPIIRQRASSLYKKTEAFIEMVSSAAKAPFVPTIDLMLGVLQRSEVYSVNHPPLAPVDGKVPEPVYDPAKPIFQHVSDTTVDPAGHSNAAMSQDAVLSVWQAELDQGSAFAIFRVNAIKEYTESFSNTTKPSATATSLNSISSTSRTIQHTIGQGNLGDSSASKAVYAALQAALNLAGGIIDAATFDLSSAIKGVLSGVDVDIPEEWDSASTSLPETSYTIELTCLYNNPVSLMTGIYVPLAMALAGTLPLQTGPRSSTSPLLCEAYVRGGIYKTLAIISSLNIKRGGGNLGFDTHGTALNMTIELGIKDLSKVVTAPIVHNNSYLLPGYDLGSDSSINEYLSVIAGVSIYDQIFPFPSIRRQMNATLHNFSHVWNPSYIQNKLLNSTVGRMLTIPFTNKVASN